MPSPASITILEISPVSPAFNSPQSPNRFSLPLTYFDALWFRFPPVARIFFYQLPHASPSFFTSTILPNLNNSLSQTLLHFLPLAGHIAWPSHSSLPFILCTPTDVVSLTVAESTADLTRLSSNQIRETIESRPYIPELPISETEASIIALQITLFPNKGFSIGITNHHAVLDGKSVTMFVKAWAFMCKHIGDPDPPLLPHELSPVFDRTLIKEEPGLEMRYLNLWYELSNRVGLKCDSRSLKVWQSIGEQPNLVRATFVLTRADVKMLKERVTSHLFDKSNVQKIHLSSFVLTCAYTLVCMVKARGGDGNSNIYFAFSIDSRSRLDPPVPENYFGNCIGVRYFVTQGKEFLTGGVDAVVAVVAERISGFIKELETKWVLDGAEDLFRRLTCLEEGARSVTVAGSTRFGVYESDFGWGRPRKVEITSTDRTGAIGLAESRDAAEDIEIGLVLTSPEMEAFASLFQGAFKHV